MDVSLVIPLYNESESLPELTEWIAKTMKENGFSYEIIYVDDGSRDGSWEVIEKQKIINPVVKGIKFRRNYGKSAALNVGFGMACGDIVVTMDADLQDDPGEIPAMRKMIQDEKFDLVSGWKKKRYDPISKTVPTKLFNWATRMMSGIKLHDFNCGLKAYRLDVVKSIEVYGEMHRYIPVIAKRAGFERIGEKEVQHRERKYGKTKFGWERFINGFLDLMTITFMSRFGKRPMHFFGPLGTLMFLIGFGISVYLGSYKLWHLYRGEAARLIADNPLFYIALTSMVLGTMLFLAGFLGELIARNSTERNNYLIEKQI